MLAALHANAGAVRYLGTQGALLNRWHALYGALRDQPAELG
ncbi:hypothetical protein [Nocardia sp. NPDC051463]